MDFGFSDEQEMLRGSARKFLESSCPPRVVRAAMESASAHDPGLWSRMAELGWLAMLVPEEHGGIGGGFLDVTVVMEEAGRALLPGPFLASAVLATVAVRESGTPEQRARLLPALARGELVMTVALDAASDHAAPAAVGPAAQHGDRGYVLSGVVPFVMDAEVADAIVVPARRAATADGMSLFLIERGTPGLEVVPLRTVDGTRRLCRVHLRDVGVGATALLGTDGTGASVVRRVLDHGLSAIATELVGTAQHALDLSVAYANTRTQFGRPIGSFQAIKHKCVDMMVAVETARALAYYAAWTVSEDAPEARQAVPMAKAYCAETAKLVTSESIQVHGGIGFTWEHDLHLYYRRALASDAAFGTTPSHREAVARALEL